MSETDDDTFLDYFPLPAYFGLSDGPDKDEARRAHVLDLLRLAEGALVNDWHKDAPKIEAWLKSGEANGPRQVK